MDDEQLFLDAWIRGIKIAGAEYFGGEMTSFEGPITKWDLAPRYDDISEAIGWLSSGEATFLVAMYGFYNARYAKGMMDRLDIGGLADIASRLDEQRRRVIADLIVSYAGW